MRLGRLIRGDIHFQWKYGFYFIYFILTLLYVCAIAALPEHWKKDIAAIMIYSDPAAMGLFFMGGDCTFRKKSKGIKCYGGITCKDIGIYTFKNNRADCYFHNYCIDIRISFREQSFTRYRRWNRLNIGNLYYARHNCSYKNFKLEPISHCNYADRNCLFCSTYCWSICGIAKNILLFSVYILHEPYNRNKLFTII